MFILAGIKANKLILLIFYAEFAWKICSLESDEDMSVVFHSASLSPQNLSALKELKPHLQLLLKAREEGIKDSTLLLLLALYVAK